MTLRAVSILGFMIPLVVAGASTDAAARHRHHRHPPSQQVDAGQKSASGERISPNPRAARMRRAEDALQKAMASDQVAGAAQSPGVLRDPKIRAQVTATLAIATLPRADLAGLRHRDGGYGWVGPVFWPFAGSDLFGAALWGDAVDATLWGYGAGDLTTGLFGIYPDDDVAAYAAYLPSATPASPQPSMLARMCGDVRGGEVAGVPVEAVQATLALDDRQRAALDDLADAVLESSQKIAAACPETLPLGAQQRVAAMRQRIETMMVATDMVAPRLSAFFDTLNDTQKAQFVALGAPPAPAAAAAQASTPPPPATSSAAPVAAAAQACAAAQAALPAAQQWPKATLERAVGRGEAARKALDGLRAAVMKASGLIAPTCQGADATTPPARLAAIRARLEAMRATLDGLAGALAPVYAALDPVETVDFDAAGAEPARAAAMMAIAQHYRAQQTVGLSSSAASRSADVVPTEAADAANSADASPPAHHGHGRRHLAHYGHRIPGPVHVIGRVLGALLP